MAFVQGISNMNRTSYILDFQGFKDENNKFILKEVAVMDIKNLKLLHWFVRQPYPLSKLSPAAQRQARFNSRFYHGIPFNYGNAPFYYIKKKLIKVLSHNTVYVKGSEKKDFLQEMFKEAKFEDLTNFPSLKLLRSRFNNYNCSFHSSNQMCPFFSCALNNVYNIHSYTLLTGYELK